ncbi:hypothetical protein HYDPIDRAFT_119749 [Hydnomerulius pinastri MD-312]|uniref:Uncharacterized protein n=1 Tax=Hydnomerulius pinastri MD-312 TaxID=994086 RepID=A0A0C9VY21_9AGAM|nr:hypothetical protein HYDPIDRAFT_119749 [Hydnomerulius pinastri MD-312]
MSTTQSPGPSTSSTSSPTPTNTSSTVQELSNSSSLLFGFLVSVLSLFAIFMACGIVWHRLVVRRRQIDAMLASGMLPTLRAPERPQMWDVWVKSDKKLPQWADANPLAAEKRDSEANLPKDMEPNMERKADMPFWRRHLLTRLPLEIVYLFHQPSPPLIQPPDNTYQSKLPLHGSDVRVSVLISMPHPPHSSQMTGDGSQEKHEELHEMVFGTTDLLYHDSGSS